MQDHEYIRNPRRTWETGRFTGSCNRGWACRFLRGSAAAWRRNLRELPKAHARCLRERVRDLSQADRDQSAPPSHPLVDQRCGHRLQRRGHAHRGHHPARRDRNVLRHSVERQRDHRLRAQCLRSLLQQCSRRGGWSRSPAGRWWLMPIRCSSASSPAPIIRSSPALA